MKEVIITVEGMSCQSCVEKIQTALKELNGVNQIEVDLVSKTVKVLSDEEIDKKILFQKIEELGYEVKSPNIQKEKNNELTAGQLLGIGVIIFAIYLVLGRIFNLNLAPQIENSMSLGLLFVIGLLTSFHCIAMCGGINISQCVVNNEQNEFNVVKPSIYYNLGRVISYTVIGGIIGGIGSAFNFSDTSRAIIIILAGILMLLIGLGMLNVFGWVKNLRFFPKTNLKGKSPFVVGLLNGLMPCGPLQSMQVYALSTGSIYMGALSMLIFSLGTVPLMFGIGSLSTFLGKKNYKKVLKISAVLVLFLGLVMVNRGLIISGIDFLPKSINVSVKYAAKEGTHQVITTTVTKDEYLPDILVIQRGVRTKWIIKVKDLNSCNSPITLPYMGIKKNLKLGENVVEFTPDKVGNMTYTCGMGMIKSNIMVVKDISKVSDEDIKGWKQQFDATNTKSTDTSSGACCPDGSSGGVTTDCH